MQSEKTVSYSCYFSIASDLVNLDWILRISGSNMSWADCPINHRSSRVCGDTESSTMTFISDFTSGYLQNLVGGEWRSFVTEKVFSNTRESNTGAITEIVSEWCFVCISMVSRWVALFILSVLRQSIHWYSPVIPVLRKYSAALWFGGFTTSTISV